MKVEVARWALHIPMSVPFLPSVCNSVCERRESSSKSMLGVLLKADSDSLGMEGSKKYISRDKNGIMCD